jgi:single-strand DNA-binding protein
MNKVIIIGNLTANPESRQVSTADGTNTVCNFNVATNRVVHGQKQTTYFRVSCWGRQAENAMKYLVKGRRVAVTGPVSARGYQAQDGTIRASLEVSAMEIEYMGGRQESAQAAPPPAGPDDFTEVDDDELPF